MCSANDLSLPHSESNLGRQFGGVLFRTVPLDGEDWGLCLSLGVMSLPVGALIRILPPFNCIPGWLARRQARSATEVTPQAQSSSLGRGNDLETTEGSITHGRPGPEAGRAAVSVPRPVETRWVREPAEVEGDLASTMLHIAALRSELGAAQSAARSLLSEEAQRSGPAETEPASRRHPLAPRPRAGDGPPPGPPSRAQVAAASC